MHATNQRPPPYSDVHQGYMGPQQGYTGPQQGDTGPQQGYTGPQQGYTGPHQGYTGPQQGYTGPQQGYVEPDHGYSGPQRQNYVPHPQQGYTGAPASYPIGQQGQSGPPPPRVAVSSERRNEASSSARRPQSSMLSPDWTDSSFSEKKIRHAFIKKVYLILMAQLSVTVVFICFFLFYQPARLWVQNNAWFYYISYLTFIVLFIALYCCSSVRRKFPTNFICLAIFTLVFSYMTATISSFHDTKIVLICLGVTTVVCFGITLFAIQTKIDFTLCSGLIFGLFLVLIFSGILLLLMRFVWNEPLLPVIWGGLAAILFVVVLIFDTQHIMGGRSYELDPEEYIFAALNLYLDIVYLFLILLCIISGLGGE